MEKYTKPVVLTMDELAEGVYAASGAPAAEANGDGGIKCDSIYMKGVWQPQDSSDWGEAPAGTSSSLHVWDALRIRIMAVDYRPTMWSPAMRPAMM